MIARAIVEQCEGLNVNTLFTYGGPHMGFSTYKKCDHWWCPVFYRIAGYVTEYVLDLNIIAPSDYATPYFNLARGTDKPTFLPELNNGTLGNLTNFAMFMWNDDTQIQPKESSWFWQYDSQGSLVKLRDSDVYKEDRIGLKKLDEAGGLWFYHGNGAHMDLEDEYIDKYLVPFLRGEEPWPS